MAFEEKDRVKIKERTRRPPNPDYDYRIHFVNESTSGPFSFLALGDSGARGRRHKIKYRIADAMADEEEINLILHLGDVVYLSGSKEGYKDRFIRAYHHWLVRGKKHKYKDMVFTKPFLPVYGNHDYYDLRSAIRIPFLGRLLSTLIGGVIEEVGSGSRNGRVFEKAFIIEKLKKVVDGCLPYETGKRTRLPNRYYWFTQGPCAFFALDSNTLDGLANPGEIDKSALKLELKAARKKAEMRREQYNLLRKHIKQGGVPPDISGIELEKVEDTLYEVLGDLADAEKEVAMLERTIASSPRDHDVNQLNWLRRVLNHPDAAGKWKIVYMHHPLYSSDESHTDDPESIGLRKNLRSIFTENNVHLVLSGHSHCFEWLSRAAPKGEAPDPLAEAERKICYIVSGGGGRSLRRSILESETSSLKRLMKQGHFLDVAESRAYTALLGKDNRESVYHYLRIDVKEEELRIIPVGMAALSRKEAVRESPIRTKVLTKTEEGITVEDKKLIGITITRDGVASGEWQEPVPTSLPA